MFISHIFKSKIAQIKNYIMVTMIVFALCFYILFGLDFLEGKSERTRFKGTQTY